MRKLILQLDLFSTRAQRAGSEAVLCELLDILSAANVLYLQRNPDTPPLYRAGVVYREERPAFPGAPIPERWKAIPYVLQDGYGDCEDLACWRTAELLCDGIAARPTFTWRPIGDIALYHIMVRLPDGRIEDPSTKLGMNPLAG